MVAERKIDLGTRYVDYKNRQAVYTDKLYSSLYNFAEKLDVDKLEFNVCEVTPTKSLLPQSKEFLLITEKKFPEFGNLVSYIDLSHKPTDPRDPNAVFALKYQVNGSEDCWLLSTKDENGKVEWQEVNCNLNLVTQYLKLYVEVKKDKKQEIPKEIFDKKGYIKSLSEFRKLGKIDQSTPLNTGVTYDLWRIARNDIHHKDIRIQTEYDKDGNPQTITVGVKKNHITYFGDKKNQKRLIIDPSRKDGEVSKIFIEDKDKNKIQVSGEEAYNFLHNLSS